MASLDAFEIQIASEQDLQKLVAGNHGFMQGQADFPTVCKGALLNWPESRSHLRQSLDAAIHEYLQN